MRVQKMNEKPKLNLLAVGVAAICSALVAAALAALATFIRTQDRYANHFGLIPVFFIFSLLAITIIGLPLYFAARKLNFAHLRGAIVLGTTGGALVSVIIRLPSPPMVNDLLVNCPIGIATAITFWLLTRRQVAS